MEYFGQKTSSGFITPKSKVSNSNEEVAAYVWSTHKVTSLIDDYQTGKADIRAVKNTPFFSKDIEFRSPNLAYEYTEFELDELKRSAKDIFHFTKEYVTIKDEDGKLLKIRHVRDYQVEMLNSFVHNRMNILMASRQIGKCYLPDTKVLVGNNDGNPLIKMPVYSLYFKRLRKMRKLTLMEYVKWGLYRLLYNLTKSDEYIK